MKILLAIMILLCIQLSFATVDDAQFVAVVGANAPNTDVITAANFAANMKLEADATFTGATDEQFQDLSAKVISQKTVVIIDGKNIEIIVGEDAPESHNVVAQRSLSYFKTLGFETTLRMREDVNPAFVTVENERDDEPNKIIVEPTIKPECDGCVVDDVCHEQGDIVGLEYCNGKFFLHLKNNGAVCESDYECLTSCADGICGQETPEPIEESEPEWVVVDEQPKANVLIRFFAWVTGLFS